MQLEYLPRPQPAQLSFQQGMRWRRPLLQRMLPQPMPPPKRLAPHPPLQEGLCHWQS